MDEINKAKDPQQSPIFPPPPPATATDHHAFTPFAYAPFDRNAPSPYGAQTLAPPPGFPPMQYGSIQHRQYEFKNHVKFKIQSYTKQAKKQQIVHDIFQVIIFAGAALVSVLIGVLPTQPWIPALISAIVAITTAIANYYKFGDKSSEFHITAENMEREYNRFKLKRNVYKNISDEEALDIFQDNIDIIQDNLFQSYLKNKTTNSNNGGNTSSPSV